MTRGPIAPCAVRGGRHQLAFELGTTVVLAAATRQWALVAGYGAVLLPAVRRTWVHWIRSGIGLLPFVVALFVAWDSGFGAVATVWTMGCLVGIARLWWRGHKPAGTNEDQRGSAGVDDKDVVGLGGGDRR